MKALINSKMSKTQIKLLGRLTAKKLVEWCNEQFEKLELNDYEVIKVERTHFTSDQYESGACRLYIIFRNKTLPESSLLHTSRFMCFYGINELHDYINSGYELYLKDGSKGLTGFELEVRKLCAS